MNSEYGGGIACDKPCRVVETGTVEPHRGAALAAEKIKRQRPLFRSDSPLSPSRNIGRPSPRVETLAFVPLLPGSGIEFPVIPLVSRWPVTLALCFTVGRSVPGSFKPISSDLGKRF
jgi:hypothetical protein